MKCLLFVLTVLSKTLLLNKEDTRKFDNFETKFDNTIEKGKARGQFDNLVVELNNDEDIQKFDLVSKISSVPEGMAEVSKNIEKSVTDEIEEMKKGERFFIIYFIDENTALLPANHPNDMIKIFVSSDKKLAEEMNTPYPGLYGFNPRDKTAYQFPLDENTAKTISSIVKTDLIGTLTYQNLETYKATGLHTFYVFVHSDKISTFVTDFKDKAITVKNQGKFCMIPFTGDVSQLRVCLD